MIAYYYGLVASLRSISLLKPFADQYDYAIVENGKGDKTKRLN